MTLIKKVKKIVENVVIYIRVSSQEQAMFGFSLEAQKNALIKYAEENGMKIVGIYADEGLSARSKLQKRKALWRMIDDIKAGEKKIDKILFIKIDRWMRSMEDYYKVQRILDKHNIEWQCTQDDYTSKDTFRVNLYLTLAQEESDRLGSRIDFVFQDKLAKGQMITGAVPRGYVMTEDKRLKIDEEEAKVIKTMFDKYEETGSAYRTMEYLLDIGVTGMSLSMLRRYLKNEIFIGNYVHKKHGRFDNFCDPIISEEQFYRVNKIIKRNSGKKSYSKIDKNYIFQGILHCKKCGGKMTASYYIRDYKVANGESRRAIFKTYRCYRYGHLMGCDMSYNISEKVAERKLLSNIKEDIEKRLKEIEIVEVKDKKSAKIDYAKKIIELENDLDRISEMYRRKKMREKQYEKQFEQINEEIAEYEAKLAEQRNENKVAKKKVNNAEVLRKLLNQPIEDIYHTLTEEEKRAFWLSIIDKAYMDRESVSLEFL